MKLLSKCIAGILVLSVTGLYFPSVSFCADSELYTRTQMKKITHHEPKIMSEPEKDIPVVATEAGQQKGPNWLMIGGAAALIVGLAAAAGGAGGGGGSNNSNGDIAITW